MKNSNPRSFLDYEISIGSQPLKYECHLRNILMPSLIKMLYWMIKKTNQPLTMKQLEHAVRRNFGGLDEVDAIGIYQKNIHIADVILNEHDPKVCSM